MDGRYPHGHFYRPVTTLSFALDHAVWGLEPSGYHLTDLALLLACAIAVAALARRLLGPGVGPLLAALLYALHPLHVETLPVAARRADTLAQLFTLIALLAAARRAARRSERERAEAGRAEASGCDRPLRARGRAGGRLEGIRQPGGAAAARARLRGGRSCAASGAPAPEPAGQRASAGRGRARAAGAHRRAGRDRRAPGSSLFASPGRGLALAPIYGFLLLMPQPVLRDPTLARALALATASLLAVALGGARAGSVSAPPAARLRRLAARRPLADRPLRRDRLVVCARPAARLLAAGRRPGPGGSALGGRAPPVGLRARRRAEPCCCSARRCASRRSSTPIRSGRW